jgi:hypothetical protein
VSPKRNAASTPEQGELATDATEADGMIVAAPKAVPWPSDAIDQVKAIADTLANAPTALPLDQIAARFKGRGPWKKRLPQLLDMLIALGKADEQDGRYSIRRG